MRQRQMYQAAFVVLVSMFAVTACRAASPVLTRPSGAQSNNIATTATSLPVSTPTPPPFPARSMPPPSPAWDIQPGQTLVSGGPDAFSIKDVVWADGQVLLFYAMQAPVHGTPGVSVSSVQRECATAQTPVSAKMTTVIPLGTLAQYDVGVIRFPIEDHPGQVVALDVIPPGNGIATGLNGSGLAWHLEPLRQFKPDTYYRGYVELAPYTSFRYGEGRPELSDVAFVTRGGGIRGGRQNGQNPYHTAGYFMLTVTHITMPVPYVFVAYDAQATVMVTTESAYIAIAGTPIPTISPADPPTRTPYPPSATPPGYARVSPVASCY